MSLVNATCSEHQVVRQALFFIIVATSCSGNPAHPDTQMRCPIGDATQPARLEVVDLDGNSVLTAIHPDDHVPLLVPPQGGFVLLLGARATNIDGCQLNITTSFRDTCGGPIIGLDRRPAQLDLTNDGWGITNAFSFGNLPVCPQVTAPRNLNDDVWQFTVTLDDLDGKSASQTMNLTPVCPSDSDAQCRCQCDHNYVLGGMCPPGGADAGVAQCLDAGI